LSEVRDAKMLVESLDKFSQQCNVEPGAVAKVHAALVANHQEVTRRVLRQGRTFPAVAEVAARALGRLSDWKTKDDGGEALEGGLRRVYRAGRHMLSLAAADPSMANLHEWRKQAKYLWHQLQLLEPAWTGHEKDLGDRVHRLSQLLGEDHDLAVLRQTLAADPLTYGGCSNSAGSFTGIRRKSSRAESRRIGGRGQRRSRGQSQAREVARLALPELEQIRSVHLEPRSDPRERRHGLPSADVRDATATMNGLGQAVRTRHAGKLAKRASARRHS